MTIREMRASLGNTRGEFAARYNIPFRTVQNWEAGVRNPPEYIMDLLESRVRADLVNRRTVELPKYNPQKRDLPKRRDYVGAMAWLKAVRDCLGEKIVFALDEALMCQGHFGGRSDEYLVWVYGDDAVTQYNGVVVLGNQVTQRTAVYRLQQNPVRCAGKRIHSGYAGHYRSDQQVLLPQRREFRWAGRCTRVSGKV